MSQSAPISENPPNTENAPEHSSYLQVYLDFANFVSLEFWRAVVMNDADASHELPTWNQHVKHLKALSISFIHK